MPDEVKIKSKSQRLRAVLYLLYVQDNKHFVDFESYYNDLMEQIINFYKNKIT